MISTPNNFTYKDVAGVLRTHGFALTHIHGNHYYFTGRVHNILHVVCVPYHTAKPLPEQTMKTIMLQSGLKDEWRYSYARFSSYYYTQPQR
jgi:predicted RNA binding protein YcfA (HicA-like mRNA interferase family)